MDLVKFSQQCIGKIHQLNNNQVSQQMTYWEYCMFNQNHTRCRGGAVLFEFVRVLLSSAIAWHSARSTQLSHHGWHSLDCNFGELFSASSANLSNEMESFSHDYFFGENRVRLKTINESAQTHFGWCFLLDRASLSCCDAHFSTYKQEAVLGFQSVSVDSLFQKQFLLLHSPNNEPLESDCIRLGCCHGVQLGQQKSGKD